ncbi:Predicted pyrophosphatase or phosphodiesterase, AlkP superfamily [Pedobacter westerhofensis]|uniref:glycerophosphocholine cholinephosphodiesterase n=1 Tax=Pedobacter westerhofensis TaxID=425512 RepID=A0A521EQR2_9SPHI|nr:alkaline phosphatase PafA [Pedobacter westerhofensis]SMO86274.1 Predicted pyrophosphatase or phosphodiesterase, AlkP superfamily [Pedobacter westerhofensis]
MKKTLLFAGLCCLCSITFAQKKAKSSTTPATSSATLDRPKLVVGLVVDQMRWDYLYRYYDRYVQGGFKRMINEGFSAENTYIPYTPTYTAVGHTSIYTGSVPAITGIIGNNWFDPQTKKAVYCTDDSTVTGVGSNNAAGKMSPKNLLSSTITDELRLATNFQGKVIGLSLKDRGSILPAGHTPTGAYWYDGETGDWITSTWYMKQLPVWLQDYNKKKMANKYYDMNWNTLYPIASYTQSTADNKDYEGVTRGEQTPTFPHALTAYTGKNYDMIRSTPYGNTITLDLAKVAIEAENLGKDNITDFLAVSCSSTDYVGHQYGPNSIEAEDTYLRLDKDIASFFDYLDKTVGKGNYLVFLSADHGAAHVPGFMQENKMHAGLVDNKAIITGLNTYLESRFKIKKPAMMSMNNQIIFDHSNKDMPNIDFTALKNATIDYLRTYDGIANAVDLARIAESTLPAVQKEMITNGYNARLSGDVYFILQPNYFDGGKTGTTHGAWNPYDSHIPCVFMGWKVKHGKTNKTHHMTDIAPTIAAMLHIQMPSGNVGEPITELTHQ